MVKIMIKILDYYYLVVLRFYDNMFKKDRLSYRVSGVVTLPFIGNLFSLALLLVPHILDLIIFWISLFLLWVIIMAVFDIVYNKKRREKLREEYKHESRESRQWGVAKVVLYNVLSIAFLVWSVSMFARRFS